MFRSMLACSFVLSLVVVRPAVAGPPWISVELPANPLNPSTRGAFLLVHSYHHGTIVDYPVTGRAIGIVDGKRRELPLTLLRTDLDGVVALRKSWPDQGRWILTLNVGGKEGPTALVAVDDGRVTGVDVPTHGGSRPWGRQVTDRDIDALLRQVATANEPSDGDIPSWAALVLLPVAVGAGALARRRTGAA